MVVVDGRGKEEGEVRGDGVRKKCDGGEREGETHAW